MFDLKKTGKTDNVAVPLREDIVTEPNDPGWSDLMAATEVARLRPSAWVAQRDIYGTPVEEPRFADAFEEWPGVIWSEGTATAPDQNLRDV